SLTSPERDQIRPRLRREGEVESSPVQVEDEPSGFPHDQHARSDVDRAELAVDDRAVHVIQIRRAAGHQAQVQRGRTEAPHSPREACDAFGVRVSVASKVTGEETVFRVIWRNVNWAAIELRTGSLGSVVRRT